jgi:hypothetical protein
MSEQSDIAKKTIAQMQEQGKAFSDAQIESKFSDPKEKKSAAKKFKQFFVDFTPAGPVKDVVNRARGVKPLERIGDDESEKEKDRQKLVKGPLVEAKRETGIRRTAQKNLQESKVGKGFDRLASQTTAAGFGKVNTKVLGRNLKENLPISLLRRVELNIGDLCNVCCDILGFVPVVGLSAAPGNALGQFLAAHGRGFDKKRAAAAGLEGAAVGAATASIPVVGTGVSAVGLTADLKTLFTPVPSTTKKDAVEQLYKNRRLLREYIDDYKEWPNIDGVKLSISKVEFDKNVADMEEQYDRISYYIDKFVGLIDKSIKKGDAIGKYADIDAILAEAMEADKEYQRRQDVKTEGLDESESDSDDLPVG